MMQSATIKMSIQDVSEQGGVVLTGPLPPAAVLTLGARVAAAADGDTFVPDGILVDREGHLHLQQASLDPRFVAPEHRHLDEPPQTAQAVVWALGRHLLELSVGAVVDDEVLARPSPDSLAEIADVDGRPLAPRLCDVLAAMLANAPEERLQSLLPTTRVCVTVARTFGDGDTALRAAVTRQLAAPLKKTKDLPARAVLDATDVARLRGATRPKTSTAKTILIPQMKDIVPRLREAPEPCATETRALRRTTSELALRSLDAPVGDTSVPATLIDAPMPVFPTSAAPSAPAFDTSATEPELPRLHTADLDAPSPTPPAARRWQVMAAAAFAVAFVAVIVAVAAR